MTQPESHDDSSPLERIAHYRLNAVVAHGGMGVVYRASDDTLDRFVALKVINDPEQAERLIEEARIASRLAHPGIASVYQAGVDEETGLSFIAFEWVEGSSLRMHLASGPLALDVLDRYMQDLAAAVAHAHREGMVHGDLKADNVVVNLEGRLKLLDFGLSAPAEELTEGDLWGTPAYMAPELLEGGPRSEASDLFALGVLLYEMATGALPFGGQDGDETSVRKRQLATDSSDPRERRPELNARVAEAITSLLILDPTKRGPGAAEVERLVRLRRRGERRSNRWVAIPVLLAVLAAAGWTLRDHWLGRGGGTLTGGNGAGTATVPESRSIVLRVGEWSDPETGEASDDSAFGRDLLTLFLSADDPGSALLDDTTTSTSESTDAELSGTWGRVGDVWRAEWPVTWGDGVAPAAGRDSVEATDPVALARAVAEQVTEKPVRQTVASTLTLREKALVSFIVGVRESDKGRFAVARDHFRRARQEAGSFPEATAWEAAVLFVLGDHDAATAAIAAQRRIASQPGSTLVSTLGVPVARGVRWQQTHRLARLVNLLLDWHEPRTPDTELLGHLARDGRVGLALMPTMEARIALHQGRVADAREALHRLRALGTEAWQSKVLERWILGAEGNAAAGDTLLKDWLLDVDRDDPGYFLVVPMALASGSLRSAVTRARKIQSTTPEARRAIALVLAIAGDFDDALASARSVQLLHDPGLAERLLAAIEMLRRDPVAAADALERARVIDPERVETQFLLAFVKGNPYRLASDVEEQEPPSRFRRWQDPFAGLSRGRAMRLGGDPGKARELLATVRWVRDDLSLVEWPELVYLAWLERVACLHDEGRRDAASAALKQFRRWWPDDRPAASRVSTQARQLKRLLDGDRGTGQ